MAQALARVYVGFDLVGLLDVNQETNLVDAQRIANTWPEEKVVLQVGGTKRHIKPVHRTLRTIAPDIAIPRKPHVSTIPRRAHH